LGVAKGADQRRNFSRSFDALGAEDIKDGEKRADSLSFLRKLRTQLGIVSGRMSGLTWGPASSYFISNFLHFRHTMLGRV
jgi:hypothetical protein